MSILKRLVREPMSGNHRGTVFLFHGSGGCAEDLIECFDFFLNRKFSFPHIKVVIPNAPLQPYTPCGGELCNVWFDRIAIDAKVSEKLDSIQNIGKEIIKLIEEENSLGIPNSKIIVGGMSMGGALAFHTGYRWKTSLAGVFAISSFLNDNSVVYSDISKQNTSGYPELLQFHGTADDLVPLKSGRDTFEQLKSLGIEGNFDVIEGLDHSVCKKQVIKICNWIQEKIPN